MDSFKSENDAFNHSSCNISNKDAKERKVSTSKMGIIRGEPVKILVIHHPSSLGTLGLSLDYTNDVLILKVNQLLGSSTKRELLEATASWFDPLGFLAPVLLR